MNYYWIWYPSIYEQLNNNCILLIKVEKNKFVGLEQNFKPVAHKNEIKISSKKMIKMVDKNFYWSIFMKIFFGRFLVKMYIFSTATPSGVNGSIMVKIGVNSSLYFNYSKLQFFILWLIVRKEKWKVIILLCASDYYLN